MRGKITMESTSFARKWGLPLVVLSLSLQGCDLPDWLASLFERDCWLDWDCAQGEKCEAGKCVTTQPTGPCDDGNACTTDDAWANGVCAGSPVDCDDGDPCTIDSCDPNAGCVFTVADNDGPYIHLIRPTETAGELDVAFQLSADPQLNSTEVSGTLEDPSGIAEASVEVEGISAPLEPGPFSLDIALSAMPGSDGVAHNPVVIRATDTCGNTSRMDLDLQVVSDYVPGVLIVRFKVGTSYADINKALTTCGGTVISYSPDTLRYVLLINGDESALASAETCYASRAWFVMRDPILLSDSSFPDDTWYQHGADHHGSSNYDLAYWHLSADPDDSDCYSVNFPPTANCKTDSDCRISFNTKCRERKACSTSHVYCESDADCGAGQTCTTSSYCDVTMSPCTTDADCAATLQQKCINSTCACTSDSECLFPGYTCKIFNASHPEWNECCATPTAGMDIGWDDIPPATVLAMQQDPAAKVTFGVIDDTVVDVTHPDLVQHLWVNTLECCARAEGTCPVRDSDGGADCTAWESIWGGEPGTLAPTCSTDSDCASLGPHAFCLRVPKRSYCLNFINKPCSEDSDCYLDEYGQKIQPVCSTPGLGLCWKGATGKPCSTDADCMPALCASIEIPPRCSDGCPGACGVDDDNDGLADENDPQVKALMNKLVSNKKDDDQDGLTDEDDEARLAALDDDEDGYIDDIHGVNLKYQAAQSLGSPWGLLSETTHRDYSLGKANAPLYAPELGHATAVAGVIAATMNNGMHGTGVHPNAVIISVGKSGDYSVLSEAMRYLSARSVPIVNMSFGRLIKSINLAKNLQNDFLADVDPGTLYVMSAGNSKESVNLDQAMDLDTGALNAGFWRFPANVKPKPGLVVSGSNTRDGFFEGSLLDILACPKAKQPNCPIKSANFGPKTVDIAAPYEVVWTLLPQGADYWWEGTSFSAPMVAAAAGLLISAYAIQHPGIPNMYLGNPELMKEAITSTVDAEGPTGFQSYLGRTHYPGRLDVGNLLADTPAPALPLFVLASGRFPSDNGFYSHHAVSFTNPDGTIYVVVVPESMYDLAQQPLGVKWDPSGKKFVSATMDYFPPFLPEIPGNYAGLDVGLIDDDPCPDLVFGGFVQKDESLSTADNEVDRGVPNFILFQDKYPDGSCAGWFSQRYDFDLDQGQPRPTMTKEVKLFDADNDGDLDLFVVNMLWPLGGPGGDVGDQLFLNEDGILTEHSELIPPMGDNHLSAWSATVCDIDGDGDLDIVETGRATLGYEKARDRILVNQLKETGSLGFVDEGEERGMPLKFWTGRAVCANLTGDQKDGSGAFAKDLLMPVSGASNFYYYENNGTGHFTARPDLWEPLQWTHAFTVCDLYGDGQREVFAAISHFNSDGQHHYGHNKLFQWSQSDGRYEIVDASSLGFQFEQLSSLTFSIACVDLDDQPGVDAVILLNKGQRDTMYLRSSLLFGP